jgi:hypothetical protein
MKRMSLMSKLETEKGKLKSLGSFCRPSARNANRARIVSPGAVKSQLFFRRRVARPVIRGRCVRRRGTVELRGGSGTTVSLSWSPPAGGASSYIIEAGSASGRVDLANLATNNSATSYVATGVPFGTYFVRVRAVTAGAVSDPSNEITVIVQSTVLSGSGRSGRVVCPSRRTAAAG